MTLNRKKQVFKECKFVGKGEEDLRDILKRQFVEYINDKKGYAYIGLKNDKK